MLGKGRTSSIWTCSYNMFSTFGFVWDFFGLLCVHMCSKGIFKKIVFSSNSTPTTDLQTLVLFIFIG